MATGHLQTLLQGRDFRRLYGVRLLGQGGDGLLQSALATFVLFSPERQPTAASVATAFAILLIPYSIVGPFAGVLLDRWSRRQVLVWANLLRSLIVVGVAMLVLGRNDGPALAITVLVALGLSRFVLAGLSASLPHVVSGDLLITANALSPTSGTIVAAIGALIGVGVRGLAGGGDTGSMVVLLCAVVAYIASAGVARRMAKTQLGPTGERTGDTPRQVIAGLVEGIRELKRCRPAGRAIAVVGAHRIVFGMLTVLGLLLIRNTFNSALDPDSALREFAIVTAGAALGAFIGAVLTPRATRVVGPVPWTAFALIQAAIIGTIGIILGGALPSMPSLIVAALSIGFAGQSAKVCADTIVQRDVSDDHLGRVFALFDMIVNVCLVLGISIAAFGSPASGVAPVLDVFAGLLLALTGIAYVTTKSSRNGSLNP